jgi:hypothetical protein
MNEYKRINIARKTGKDPLKKEKSTHIYGLYNLRDGSLIIKGAYSLCVWKKKKEKEANPLLATEIKIYTGL